MAQISNTRRKFREARFFLANMQRAARSTHLDREDFDFYLSAFLSAARSVTWVLQKEQKASYDAWYPGWKQVLGAPDQALLTFMNEQRVAELKKAGAEKLSEIQMVPLTQFDWEQPSHPAYGWTWVGPPGVAPPEMGVVVHYFENGGQKVKVLDECKRYLALLERLIAEFDAAFP